RWRASRFGKAQHIGVRAAVLEESLHRRPEKTLRRTRTEHGLEQCETLDPHRDPERSARRIAEEHRHVAARERPRYPHRKRGWPASSRRITAPDLRSVRPSIVVLRQFHNSRFWV